MNPTTIQIIRGTDNSLQVTFTDANGAPVDLTGQSVYFTVKSPDAIDESDTTDANALIQVKASNGASPSAGIATVVLSNTVTSIPAGNYKWDLRLISGASPAAISAVQSGELDILEPITNRKS